MIAPDGVSDGLLRRACGEFLEMPGLQLTSGQARRLWDLDERTCCTLLRVMVDAGFLRRTANGAYVRRVEGRWSRLCTVIHGGALPE